MIKKIIILTLILATSRLGFTQIEFGPYLTYPGIDVNNKGQMTIHIGLPTSDTKTYYIAFWKDGEKVQVKQMNNIKKIWLKSGECGYIKYPWECSLPQPSYNIASCTLNSLSKGSTYNYFVSDQIVSLSGYTFSAKTTIVAKDLSDAGGKLLLKSAILSGSFSGVSGSIVQIASLGLSNVSIFSNNLISIYNVPAVDIHSFLVPDNNASTLSVFVTSDTQKDDNMLPKDQYFKNIISLIDNGQKSTMVIHAGDFHNGLTEVIDERLKKFASLFAEIPFQVAEGNHDLGFYHLYSPEGIVQSESEMSYENKKYTESMIWFDKLWHYDYPGLATPVTVMKNGVKTATHDYYSSYYSYDNGPVHFAQLDMDNLGKYSTTKDTGYVGKQLRWLVDDLNATDKKFKVIVVHSLSVSGYKIPFAYKGVFSNNNSQFISQILDKIIEIQKVAVVISGHWHDEGVGHDTPFMGIAGTKNFLHMEIGNISVHRNEFYKLDFNENDDTFYYTRYDPQNVGTKGPTYKLDATYNVIQQ